MTEGSAVQEVTLRLNQSRSVISEAFGFELKPEIWLLKACKRKTKRFIKAMRAAASTHFDVWTRRADVPSVQSAPKRLTMHEIKKAEKNSSRPEPDKTYHITGKKTIPSPWQQAGTLPPGSVTRERVRKR